MSRITRSEFIKTAVGGTAGVAFLGTTAVAGSTYPTYLPIGGSRMNVVVVGLGNLRRDHVGAYGNDWIQTPNLDALARESTRFTQPYPESLPTINARRTIYTGLRTWPFRNWEPYGGLEDLPAGWQWIPEGQSSFVEPLVENEYEAGLATDNYHQRAASMNFHRGYTAFDFLRGQELDRLRSTVNVSDKEVARYVVPGNDEAAREKVGQHLANTPADRAEEDYYVARTFRRGMEFLEVADQAPGPFFLMVDGFEPHEPWLPPQEYANMYGDSIGGYEPSVPNYGRADYLEEDELRRMRNLYAGSVTMTDRWLGRFMDKLQSLGLMDKTLLVVFSEHGVALGEHGYTGKVPEALWPELTGNVLYVRHPSGRGAGQTSDFRASLQDIAPTVLGVAATGLQTDGQDLTPILGGGQPEQERDHLTLGYDNYSWTQDDDYALSVRNDGSEARLYDLSSDPEMNENVASANPDVVRRMYRDYIVADAGGEPPPIY